MKLQFKNKQINVTSDMTQEEIVQQINEWLGKEYYFSHLLIDGLQSDDTPEEAIMMQLGQAEKIEIVGILAEQFIFELLESTEQYLQRALPLLPALSEQFYDVPTEEDWLSLNDVFVALQWLSSVINTIDESIVKVEGWERIKIVVEPMQNVLPEFESALENQDTVLIGDLLLYEVQPVFENLQEQVQSILVNEGDHNALH